MKVILVDNLVWPEQGSLAMLDVHPHLGLLALAGAAEAVGHAVEIYDPKRLIRAGRLPYDGTLYGRVAAELLARHPDAVGFTTLGCSFLFAINVAAELRRAEPELPILLGGPHATMLHREILERFPQFDVVVRHEADEIFVPVLDNLERRRFDWIPGISWRTRSGLRMTDGKPKVDDLDRLPIVSYDHYPVAELDLSLLRIEAGRGCPFACTFCSTAGFFQRSFRLKSAERLVRELDVLHARYGCSDFKLDHDMFTVNRRKVVEFCEAVRGRGYRWRASARVDGVDPELLEVMAGAGCVGLYFGIETGSTRMQRICKKRLDLQLVLPILDVARRVGIETTVSFITGYPEELEPDQDDTLDLLGRCYTPGCLPQLHPLAPEPGTPMFEQHGDQIAYDGYSGRFNAELVGDGDEALVRAHPDIFQTYYYYPAALPRARHIFAVEAVELLRRLGPVVVRHVLRGYGGRLAELVRALRHFAEATRGTLEPPDAGLFLAFADATFGPRHPVASLFRFALRDLAPGSAVATPPPGEPPAPAEPAAFDPAVPYRCSRRMRVLSEIHDCGLLLAQLARSADREGPGDPDDPDDPGELGAYLVTETPGGPVCYWVEPGLKALIELFEEPRTCREVTALVRDATGASEIDLDVFEALVRAEILVPSPDSPRAEPP